MVLRKVAFVLGLLLAVPATVHPATIRVPADQPTIQAGIDAASIGDTVLVAAGTYTGDGNRDLDFAGVDLVLMSEAGPEQTNIDCGGSPSDPHRALSFHSGETAASVVQGFAIRNGQLIERYCPEGCGGAILCQSSSPTIRNCHFFRNQVNNGIAPPGGNGGAISCAWSNTVIENCTFVENSATYGGAVDGYLSNLTLRSCTMRENFGVFGGAVGAGFGGGMLLTSCVLDDNIGQTGVAVRMFRVDLTLESCTLHHNLGEAMIVMEEASLLLSNTILGFNEWGFAVHCYGGTAVDVFCCDVYGNVGNYEYCLSGFNGIQGNFSEDPMFCDPSNDDLALHADSPCAPENSPTGCGLIGAVPVACGAADVATGDAPPVTAHLSVAPNPVRGVAEFAFPGVGPRVLSVFDSHGRLIDRLTGAGGHWVWTPGASAPPGVYFARMDGGAVGDAVKFIYLR